MNKIKMAKALLAASKMILSAEVASVDGKYGKKDKEWSGTIDYNGTKGIVTNAIFELKNGRILWKVSDLHRLWRSRVI